MSAKPNNTLYAFQKFDATFNQLTVTETFTSQSLLGLGTQTPSTAAVLMAAGSSSNKETTASANKNFVEFRFENTAASGDNRGIYNRLYIAGAGGGGESLRSFTTVDNVAASTAHGAHISINFGATGSVTGQAVAMRGTLHIPNAAVATGTHAAVQAEIYADGASSDISGVAHSLFRGVVDGDATGAATVDTFMSLSVPAPASGAFIDTDETTGAAYAGLKVNIEGVGQRWLRLYADS